MSVQAQTRVLPDQYSGRNRTETTLPNGWKLTPAGKPIILPGDMPMQMIISVDSKDLIVNTAGYHDHTVNVIDLKSGKLKQSVNVGKDWDGMCLDTEGDDLYLSGGGAPSEGFLAAVAKKAGSAEIVSDVSQPIIHLKLDGGVLSLRPGISVPGIDGKDRWISGLASGPGDTVYAINLNTDTIFKIGGRPKSVIASAKVGYRPLGVSLSPDGKTVAVSNWGDQSVSLLDPVTLSERARVAVGSHPNSLVYSKDGRLFVANSGSNSVSVIQGDRVVETLSTTLTPIALIGSTPDAVAVSPDGKRLFVANADNNDVAVVDISDPSESRLIGFIPTGWYPSSLAVSPDSRRLYIGTGKGLGFRSNAAATDAYISTGPEKSPKFDYIAGILSGAVSVVNLPDARGLQSYSKQVLANVPHAPSTPATGVSGFSNIKHVVYIIRENRTYDQVLGDLPQGNGDPNLVLFGKNVTPNAHKIATNYVLLDNLYCNGEVSEDGHQWCDAAYDTDFNEKSWPNSYSGRGEPDADERLQNSPAGYLWDDCEKHGLTYRSYAEHADFTSTPGAPPVFNGDTSLNGHASAAYTKYDWFSGTRDVGRANVFIDELHAAEATGDWPNFMVMSLPEDHTQGLSPGGWAPTANAGENDLALGMIVDAVSHSKFWSQTAIFVIEDDAQNGPDHVDAHRTVGLVISPYVKQGVVDSTMYSTASMVHTMELILGLPPMSQYDQAATPLYNSFDDTPELTPYDVVQPSVDLNAVNPPTGPGEQASAKLDFSAPDRADPDILNRILWDALRPGQPMPAPVRRARL